MMKQFDIILIAACGFGLASCQEPTEVPPLRPVLSIIAQPADAVPATFVGVIAPTVSVTQSFRLGGTLLTRAVDLGQTVRTGDVLARLETTTLELAVDGARANLAAAEAQYANASALEDRLRILARSDALSAASFEQAELQTQATRSAMAQAKASVDQAKERLSQANIIARFDGVVTAVGAEPGTVVAAGQMIVTLARTEGRDLLIDAPEDFVRQVEIGTRFAVAPQLDPQAAITGTVREIAPEADPVTRSWRLKLGLEKPPANFWLGTTAVAKLDGKSSDELFVPASAILNLDEGSCVWVVDESAKTVVRRLVKIGDSSGENVAIVSGIEPGTRVVIAGARSLKDGQSIKLD